VGLAAAAAAASNCPGGICFSIEAAETTCGPSIRDAGADADGLASDIDCSTDAGSVSESQPFDAWLQQAEQAARQLFPSSQAGNSPQLCSSDSAVAGSDAVGARQYHQQLESMLQAVEQLECELQERARVVRH
jgi:hypothetical protein